jgi:predicted Zn-dependent protease
MSTPQELIEKILAKVDFDECMVLVDESTEANLRWANSTLTTNGMISSRKVTVIAFVAVEGAMASGTATRADVSDDEISQLLREAVENAHAAGAADDYADIRRDFAIGDWNALHQATGPDVFGTVAPALGDTFSRSVADGIELFGYAEHSMVTTWLGSKGGLRLRYDLPTGRIEMTAKSHGRTRSTWEGRSTRDFTDIDVLEVDSALRTKLEWQSRQLEAPAGRYETVFTPSAVTDLLVYALWMADARSAHEGRSVFSKKGGGTRVGELIANVPINLYSDPTYAGMEAAPFLATAESGSHASVFDNGQSLGRVDWIKDGHLASLVQTRSTAALTQLPFTPFGDNVILEAPGATGSTMDLVASTESGLLVNTLWYIRTVVPVTLLLTGLTRDGVYKIEGGEVVGAVNNFRWNESPVDLWSRISAIGATEITQAREWAGDADRMATPAIRFSNFNMSTVSQAN